MISFCYEFLLFFVQQVNNAPLLVWFKIIDVFGNATDPSFLSLVIEILCAMC